MGQGGKILLANKTPYRWKKTHNHSYQMNSWNDNFPQYIEPGHTASVYVEWNQGVGHSQVDDAGEIRYELEHTSGLTFEVQARAKKGFDLKIHLVNFATKGIVNKGTISLGWEHDGVVFFALAGPKENLLSYASGQPAREWLSFIDNNTLLTDLTLPGTHDTCTYRIKDGVLNHLSSNTLTALLSTLPAILSTFAAGLGMGITQIIGNSAQCQTLTLSEQLEKGIRFLDIRLKNISNKLMAYHGPVALELSFDEVFNECRAFLNAHPKESIVMSVKCEDSSDISVLLKAAIDSHTNLWFTENRIPKLIDMRNKIVLIRRYSLAPSQTAIGIDATHWPDNMPFTHTNAAGIQFDIQDEYQSYLLGQQDHKFKNYVLPCLNRAVEQGNRSKLFLNFLSGTGGVFPVTLSTGRFSSFAGTNALMSQHISTWNTSRLGIIPIDYPEYPAHGTLIQQLIALNTFSQQPQSSIATAMTSEQEQTIA
jgi:1-phosphatidylinositol phosphodiesterase